jgi:D-alanyl-D-alanine carboxypeptidase
MMLTHKVLHGTLLLVGLAVIGVCVWLLLEERAPAPVVTAPPMPPPSLVTTNLPFVPTAFPRQERLVRTAVTPPAPPAPQLKPAPMVQPLVGRDGLARVWSYEGALSGNNLPIKNVAQIPAGILINATSGRVLWSKNARTPREIASMTKVMTAVLALEAIARKALSLQHDVHVSRNAALIGGSQVYLKHGETFSLAEMLKALMIVSANDAAYAIAESVAGSERAFVQKMNARAKQLGMQQTRYYNPHGLPGRAGNNVSSALDMALLAREALKHRVLIQWASTWTDTFRNGTFALVNHNRLVQNTRGVDGLKTGYYSRAGFSATVTAMRNGQRMIAVVIGVKHKRVRDDFLKALFEWGYAR